MYRTRKENQKMLDRIINFIADAFTPKVVSATNTNQNVWIGGYIQCWKRAGIIMYRIAFNVTAVTSRTTIGTIPEAYRPRAESYYYLKDGGLVVFGTNGSIEIDNTSGGSYYETAVCIGGGTVKAVFSTLCASSTRLEVA